MKNNIKNKKGITLIALVVTIIVLLILAGISINMVISENGIIGKAIDAKIRTEVSQIKQKANEEELRGEEVIIEGKYAEKLIYEGNNEYSYNPDKVSEREKEVFEDMDIDSLEDIYEYGTYTKNGEELGYVKKFSEIGERKIKNGVTKFTIPSKRKDGLKIAKIGDNAFNEYVTIEEINVGVVTEVGRGAFNGCTNLKSVSGLENVTSFGSFAFSWCINLKNVSLGKATCIPPYCFWNCKSLKKLEIPNTVVSISERSFQECSSLEKVIIPESVTDISYEVWALCYSIKEIRIPASVKVLGGNCFSGACTTDAMLYVPFTAEEGAPEGWGARWNRSKAHFIYSDGTEETDNSKKYL